MGVKAVQRPERMFATRALVADDDPILRGLMRARLAGIVDEVVEASDGLEAWQLLLGGTFHLAVVDLMMPSLNGFALIQCMRGHPRTRHMPIVVVTSSDDRASIHRALESGASAVMAKPVAWATFKAHVQHLMRLASSAEAAERAVERQGRLIEAHATLFAALAGLSHSCLRRVGSALNEASCSSAAHPLLPEIEAAQAAADRLRGCHAMIATHEMLSGTYHDLHGLLQAAVCEARGVLPAGVTATLADCSLDLEAACGRDAVQFCVSSAIVLLAGRAGPGASILVDREITPSKLSLSVEVGGEVAFGIAADETVVELALAAHLPASDDAFELALLRTLLAAHGGDFAATAAGLVLSLPADRARPRRGGDQAQSKSAGVGSGCAAA